MAETVTFAHITDLHVGNPAVEDKHLHSDTHATMRAILANIAAMQPPPAFIVASGDLTNRGDVASYLELKRLIEEANIDPPIVYAIGNHDTRPGFYEGMFGRTEDSLAPYYHAQVIAGIHIITLDSSAPGEVGGSIEPEQFAWLKAELDSHPELPKLIVVHHAPILDEDNKAGEWEAINGADTAKLREMLVGRGNVVGILSGHMHYDRVSNWNGIPVVTGMGQHAAMDVLWLNQGLRMVEGTSFAIGTIRPSGLSIAFAPMPSTRREVFRHTFGEMAALSKAFRESAPQQQVAAE